MIKKLLNFTLFLCMLVLGASNAWGTDVTFDLGYTTTDVKSADWNLTEGEVTLSFSKGDASSYPSPNKEGSVRFYAKTTLTISTSTDYVITKVDFTPTSSTYSATNFKYEDTALSSDSWTLETPTNNIVLTASANARFKKIVVTYVANGSTKTATTTSFGTDAQSAYTTYLDETFTAPTATVSGGEGLAPTYSSSNTDVATVDASTGAVTLVAAGTAVIKASYAGDDTYEASSASYTLTVGKVYTNLAALVADGEPTSAGVPVKVTLTNEVIQSFYTTTSSDGATTYRNGIFLLSGTQSVELYCKNVPSEWAANGTVSGTVTGSWKLYSSTWEIVISSWDQLTYTAAAKQNQTITLGAYKTTMTTADAADTYTASTDGNGDLSVASSNTSVATVAISDGTVTVTPVAVGTTTITITAAATDTYNEGSKSYTLTVNNPTTPASLPFTFDDGVAAISSAKGMTQTGLGSDYSSSPKLKFDSTGDELVINFEGEAKTLAYTIKGNSFSKSTFDVLESADGITYTSVKSYTELGTAQQEKFLLLATSRYVKFVYTEKSAGNVALGAITISDELVLDDPKLAFEKNTYSFVTTATDMTVKAASAAGSTGAITYALTEGDESKFSINETTGEITCTTAGTYTVTATIAAATIYNSATATCVVTIIDETPASVEKALVVKYGDKYYALGNDLSPVEVVVTNDYKVYAANGVNANMTWTISTTGTTSTIVNADGKYLTGNSKTTLDTGDDSFSWDYDATTGTWSVLVGTTTRTFLYSSSYEGFKNYAYSNADTEGYSSLATAYDITEPVKYTRNVTTGNYGTICLPYAVAEDAHTGADFYTISGIGTNGATLTLEGATTLEAGKPYLFLATADVVECTYNGEAVAAPASDTYLAGTFTAITAEAGWYVMQKQNGVIGFYEVGTTTPTIGANRAYMKPQTSGIKGFTFDKTDAVEAIEALTKGDAKIYDINGRQLQKMQKGINIVNGYKVIVK